MPAGSNLARVSPRHAEFRRHPSQQGRHMDPAPLATQTLTADDLAALRRAKHELESPALAMKLASIVGSPLEKLIARMPAIASDKVNDATQLALRKCLQ